MQALLKNGEVAGEGDEEGGAQRGGHRKGVGGK